MAVDNKKVCLLALFAAGAFFLHAQKGTYIGAFIVEKDIETEAGAFPIYDDLIPGGRHDYTRDQLFDMSEIVMRPVGWTEDGLFSFQLNDSRWGMMTLLVTDTITDEIIGEWDVSHHGRLLNNRNDGSGYFQDWEKEKTDLLLNEAAGAPERLHANRHLVDVPLTLTGQDMVLPQSFPLVSGRSRYNCWFEYTIEKAKTPEARSAVKWKLYAGNGLKSKVVTSGEYETTGGILSGRRILGYYKSPFENRIVIVVQSIIFGAETSRSVFLLYGCHLDIGFK